MRFQCYEAIGVAIGEAGNVKAADHLIEDILYWQFQYPDVSGTTDEWETVVNPYHLPKIRCWMHIIESNPALFERLAAALNVQLRLGGVYIADTDLFQRDVTRFLNADIRPIYFVAKQLLRTFPVYFAEVGAEGELRSVSTQIDELCGRRDTLMHFLRKQVHAESSNRLVAFSRAVHAVLARPSTRRRSRRTSRRTRCCAVREERRVGRGAAPRAARPPRRERRGATDAAAPGPPPTRRSSTSCSRCRRPALEARLTARAGLRGAGGERDGVRRRLRGAVVRRLRAARRPAGAHAPAAGPQVLAHRRRRRRRRRSPPAARPRRAPDVRSRPGGVAGAPRAAHPRPPPGRGAGRARAPQGHRPRSGAVRGAGEHLPEAPHRRRHPLHLRHLHRAQVRRAGSLVPRREPRRPAARRPRGRGHRARTSPGSPCAAWRRPSAAWSAPSPSTAPTRVPSAPTSRCSRRASAATTSRSASTRTCSSSSPTASRSCPPRPSSATSRCCTPRWSTTRASARRAASRWTPPPRWCCARCWSRPSACRTLDRFVAAALRRISLLNGRLGSQALTRMMNYDPERLVSPLHKPRPSTDDQMTLGLQGVRPQADGGLRPPRARGLRAHHRAVRGHAGDVVPAALRRHHPARPEGPGQLWSGRPVCGSATRRACCCCPSARAPPSPCPGS